MCTDMHHVHTHTTVSVCPSSVAMRCFVALSHSPPVSSPLPVAIKLAFDGCSATQYISPVCPSIRPFETSTTGSSSSTLCAPASSSSSSSSISSSPSSSSCPSSSHATRPWSAGSEGSMKTCERDHARTSPVTIGLDLCRVCYGWRNISGTIESIQAQVEIIMTACLHVCECACVYAGACVYACTLYVFIRAFL